MKSKITNLADFCLNKANIHNYIFLMKEEVEACSREINKYNLQKKVISNDLEYLNSQEEKYEFKCLNREIRRDHIKIARISNIIEELNIKRNRLILQIEFLEKSKKEGVI